MNHTILNNVLSNREKLEKARKQALEDMYRENNEAVKLEFPKLKGKTGV